MNIKLIYVLSNQTKLGDRDSGYYDKYINLLFHGLYCGLNVLGSVILKSVKTPVSQTGGTVSAKEYRMFLQNVSKYQLATAFLFVSQLEETS